MEARISFIEAETNHATSARDAGALLKFTEESYLQELIRARIVTHRFKPTEQFDAMFAASEIHELPEVSFVAAFKHGVIFLGCPHGPPESIADLVEPVTIINNETDLLVSEKLDEIMEKMGEEITKQETEIVAVSHSLSDLHTRLNDTQKVDYTEQLNELGCDSAYLKSIVNTVAPQTQFSSEVLRKLEERIEAIAEKNNSSAHTLEKQTALIDAITLKLDTLVQHTHFADNQNTSDIQISEVLEKWLSSLRQELRLLKSQPIDSVNLLREIEALPNKLRDAVSVTDISSVMKRLDSVLKLNLDNEKRFAGLQADLQSVASTAQSEMAELKKLYSNAPEKPDAHLDLASHVEVIDKRFGQLETQIQSLSDAISAMSAKFLERINFPSAKPDLTEQRQSFARFATALSSVIARLDKAISELNAPRTSQDADEIQSFLKALPATLRETISSTREETPQNYSQIRGDIGEVLSRLTTLETLKDLVQELGQRPDPVPDFSEQRRGFARFVTAMGAVVNRLEHAVNSLSSSEADTFDSAAIMQGLADINALLLAIHEVRIEQSPALRGHIDDSSAAGCNPLDGVIDAVSKVSPNEIFSLEETRLLFAEQLALQIRERSERE